MLSVLLIFIVSCSKLAKEDPIRGIISNEISKKPEEDHRHDDKYYDKMKSLIDKKTLSNYSDDKGANLLISSLNNDFSKKYKIALFFDTLIALLLEKGFGINIFEKDILFNINVFYKEAINSSANYDKLIEIIKNGRNLENREIYKKIQELLNSVDNGGKSLIFYLIDREIEYLIDLFIDKVDLEVFCEKDITLLKYIILKKPNMLRYLFDKGYLKHFNLNPNRDINSNSKDPLVLAITTGNVNSVKILLKAGCDPNSIDENKNKAILIASDLGNYELVDILIVAGAKTPNKEKIISRKIKKAAVKYGVILAKTVSESVSKIAPIGNTSFSPAALSDELRKSRQHSLSRTKLYNRIYKRFLKGKWIKLQNDVINDEKFIKNYIPSILKYTQDVKLEKQVNNILIDNTLGKIKQKVRDTFKKLPQKSKDKIENKILNLKTLKSKIENLKYKAENIDEKYLTENKKSNLNSIKNELNIYDSYEQSPIYGLNQIFQDIETAFNEDMIASNLRVKIMNGIQKLDKIENNIKTMYNRLNKIKNYLGD